MSRSMGDAIHANVQTLVPLHLQLVAGYDTGTPDIKWTPADWALFPGVPHVHIDQGYGTARSLTANVLDFEAGAFNPAMATLLINANESPDPTVYVNRDNMGATIFSARQSPKFKGAVWLSFPGWNPGDPLPALPTDCRYVAIQNRLGGPYDLSVVLDDTWPGGAVKPYNIPGIPGTWTGEVTVTPNADGSVVVSGYGTNGNLYVVKAVGGKWGSPVPA